MIKIPKIGKIEAEQIAWASSLGITLVVSTSIGIFLGLGFDRVFKTKPIGFLVFFVLGTGSGFYNVLRGILKKGK